MAQTTSSVSSWDDIEQGKPMEVMTTTMTPTSEAPSIAGESKPYNPKYSSTVSVIDTDIIFDTMAKSLFLRCKAQACFADHSRDFSFVAIRKPKSAYVLYPVDGVGASILRQSLQRLNVAAACTITSDAVRAVMNSLDDSVTQVTLSSNEHIQVVHSLADLAHARPAQMACFVRQQRLLVVWSMEAESLVETARGFRLQVTKFIWRRSQAQKIKLSSSANLSDELARSEAAASALGIEYATESSNQLSHNEQTEKESPSSLPEKPQQRRFWERLANVTGKSPLNDEKDLGAREKGNDEVYCVNELESTTEVRPVMYYQAFYGGIAFAACVVICGNFVRVLLRQSLLDHVYMRLAIAACVPFLFFICLFACESVVFPLAMIFMPIGYMSHNSLYYSGKPPRGVLRSLPHMSIVIPVYKESLSDVLAPTIRSASKAVQTYELQGGTANIIICEDGLQVVDEAERSKRESFYDNYHCSWVARPPQNRAGRFKKPSNLNVMHRLSLKIEMIMDQKRPDTSDLSWCQPEEDRLYSVAMDEALAENEGIIAAGDLRLGDYILLLDSDTRIPEDCLLDAANEMEISPEVAVLQHCSGTFLVGAGFFETGIAFFTRLVNFTISWIVAGGGVPPFMGHNAFLRWSALQHQATVEKDGSVSIWSEEHVSEDFVMSLKLQKCGYIIRWATYSKLGYLEGVSLSCGDELNRWQKYAWGCSEIVFNPLKDWLRKGPFSKVWREFLWSSVPLPFKANTLCYVTSYWAMAVAVPITFFFFVLQAVTPDTLDQGFLTSNINTPFSVFFGVIFIFVVESSVGKVVARYRAQDAGLLEAIQQQLMWTPLFVCFFTGLSWHILTALMVHITGFNMTWSATVKDITTSNMFVELGMAFRRFWRTFLIMSLAIIGIAAVSLPILPLNLRTPEFNVIFPIIWIACMHIAFPIVLNPWVLLFRF